MGPCPPCWHPASLQFLPCIPLRVQSLGFGSAPARLSQQNPSKPRTRVGRGGGTRFHLQEVPLFFPVSPRPVAVAVPVPPWPRGGPAAGRSAGLQGHLVAAGFAAAPGSRGGGTLRRAGFAPWGAATAMGHAAGTGRRGAAAGNRHLRLLGYGWGGDGSSFYVQHLPSSRSSFFSALRRRGTKDFPFPWAG